MSQPTLPRLRTSRTSIADEPAAPTPVKEPCQPVLKSPWVLGLCSVLFDVDKGQTLRDIWPLDCLSEEEKAAVAFHAFPDSLSMELYTRNAIRDSSFSFRIKREPESCTSAGVPEFLYGYVFCRQRQDETLRRGGEQVSVLVLATTPFSGVLQPLSQAAGHSFFNEGSIALAMIYNQVLAWPPPMPGSSMCLPLGSGVLNVRVPYFSLLPPPQPAVDPAVQVTLARRLSKSLSRRQSGSPRMSMSSSSLSSAAAAAAAAAAVAAVAAQSGVPAHSSSGELAATTTGAPAATEATVGAASQQRMPGEGQPHQAGEAAAPGSTAAAQAAGAEAAAAGALVGQPATSNGSAASADDASWAMVGDAPQQEQQQQEAPAEPGMSSRGSFSSLLGLSRGPTPRTNSSSSRLSRPDSAAAAVSSNSNGVTAGDSSSNGTAIGSSWLVSTFGQQWRDEKPFPEVEPALVLAPLLRDLWTLWQLVVTAQPLLVVGLNPGETSAAVAALVSLIAPLPYAADHRPYFTIHDPDFVALASGQLPVRKRYHEVLPQQQQPAQAQQQQQQDTAAAKQGPEQAQNDPEGSAAIQQQQQGTDAAASQEGAQGAQLPPEQQQPPQNQQQHRKQPKPLNLPALVGITNLYFIKALPQWPNVVAVSRKELVTPPPSLSSRSDSPAKPTSAAGSGSDAAAAAAESSVAAAAGVGPVGASSRAAASPLAAHVRSGSGSGSGFFSSTAAAAVRALQRRQQGPQHLLSHFAPHMWTHRHVQCVKPDHALLSKARTAIEPVIGSFGSGIAANAGVHSSGSSSGGSSGVGPSSAAGTAAARLRRHFAELTAGLLAPFEVYFNPGPSGKVPAWRPDAFLASLEPAALHPALSARLSGNASTAAATLYGVFIESPNFAFWFKERRAPVLHLVEDEPESDEDEGFSKVALGAGDISDGGVESDPGEVELVQQLLSTEQVLLDWQQLGRQQKAGALQQELGLQQQVVQAFLQLPPDMQVALFSSPARQEQLQEAAAALAAGSSDQQAAAAAVLQKMQALLLVNCPSPGAD